MLASSYYTLEKVLKLIFPIILLIFLGIILWKYKKIWRLEDVNRFREEPFIFIGGVPRSGTTLMRSLLDAHPDVRCGQETNIIPQALKQFRRFLDTEYSKDDDVADKVQKNAASSFIFELIRRHGSFAPRLCNKDPYLMMGASLLSSLFPQAKFLLMVRDGRANVHSIMNTAIYIGGFKNQSDWGASLTDWNTDIKRMIEACHSIGDEKCMMVQYELLILRPKEQMHRITNFLELEWSDNVLHHQDFINKENGIALSVIEPSRDQVKKPLYVDSLYSWMDDLPDEVANNVSQYAPMLIELGYNVSSIHPTYGEPEPEVAEILKTTTTKNIYD